VATNIGNLAVLITGNTSGLATALKEGESLTKKFEKDITKRGSGKPSGGGPGVLGLTGGLSSGLSSGIGAGLGVIGGMGVVGAATSLGSLVAGIAVDSVKIAARFEDIQTSFRVLLGDGEKAKDLFGQITGFAVKTPFTTGQLADQARMLLASGTEADQIIPTLRMLGDLAMGDAERLGNLVRIYDQVRGTGTLTGHEMREFVMSGGIGGLGEALAASMGRQRAELHSMIAEGKVGFSDVQRAMVAMTGKGGKFFGGMAEGAKTFNGLLSTLKDNWELLLGSIGQAVIEEFNLKPLMTSLSDLLARGRDGVDAFRPVLRDLKGAATEFTDALFNGLVNSAVAAAELVNWVNRLQKSMGASGGPAGNVDSLMTWQEKYGSLGGLTGTRDMKYNPLNYMGPGGASRLGHWLGVDASAIRDVTNPAAPKEGDLINVGKIAGTAKEVASVIRDAIAGGGKDAAGWIGTAAKLFQQPGGGLAAHLAQIRIEADKLNDDQIKYLNHLKEGFDPIGAMMKELGDVDKIAKRGGFNIKSDDPNQGGFDNGLYNFALAGIFNRYAKEFDGQAKLASAALKDSAEAVSAIAQHRTGREDPQARVANVLDQMRQEMARRQDDANRLLAGIKALMEKSGPAVSINPLRP
jgi:tape measure domain-containing protein